MMGFHQPRRQYNTYRLWAVIALLVGAMSVQNAAAQNTVVIKDTVLVASHSIGASQNIVLGPNVMVQENAQVTLTAPQVAMLGPVAVARNGALQIISAAPTTSVEQESAPLPERFTVYPNYPNPFNPGTKIRFALPRPAKVEAVVYDLSGRRVKTLLNGFLRAGWHSVTWDGTNALGHRVASGVYLYTIRSGAEVVTGKMTLVQ